MSKVKLEIWWDESDVADEGWAVRATWPPLPDGTPGREESDALNPAADDDIGLTAALVEWMRFVAPTEPITWNEIAAVVDAR